MGTPSHAGHLLDRLLRLAGVWSKYQTEAPWRRHSPEQMRDDKTYPDGNGQRRQGAVFDLSDKLMKHVSQLSPAYR